MSERLAGALASAIVAAVLLAGCAAAAGGEATTTSGSLAPEVTEAPTGTPSPSPTPPATPVALEVHCDADLVTTVSSDTVTATPAGVPLLVSSDAPAGAYLNYPFGGDALPSEPAMWMLTAPPGEWELWCSTLDEEGAAVTVTVVDPHGHWSDATLADFGCERGAIPSWAIGPVTGTSAEDAVANLMAELNEGVDAPAMTRSVHAVVGYPEAAAQTWVIGTDFGAELTAVVSGAGSSFSAGPDWLCVAAPWPAGVLD